MLLVEHLYRSTRAGERWGSKIACLAIGAIFAYDFYLFSDALLLRRISPELWAARGIANALCAPLLVVAARRRPVSLPGVFLSRELMFRSAALLGSALYLLAMAASAYYLRSIGGAWGGVMQLACLFGAGLLLAGVLFSGTVRARLKVAINKHFYRGRFDYRQEWLRFTRGLSDDGPAAPALDVRVIQAMAALVESPAGALWVRREQDACVPVASWNMPLPGACLPPDSTLYRLLEQRQWLVDVDQNARLPHIAREAALPDWLAGLPGLWLVVPLMLQGRLFGMLCLARPRAPIGLNWELRDVLKIAGSQAAGYLAHRASADSLAVARQFESFNRMSAFIVHDLKNLVSQLSLLLANAQRHQTNPAFQQDMLETLSHSVDKMKSLLQKLSRGEARETAAPLPLDQLLAQAVSAHAARQPTPVLEVHAAGLVVLANWQRLERVLGHLIQNAIEATPRDGRVLVRLSRAGAAAVVELSDTGHGMSDQFLRERLFQPFETTKTAGMGIGVFESREYIHAVGGRIEVASAEAVGTTFRVTLPLHREAAAA
jgi:putative PEP-CTERM system histidine kinase